MAFWSSGWRSLLRLSGEAVSASGQTWWPCNADNATVLFLDVSVNYRNLFTLKRYQAFYLQFITFPYAVSLQHLSLKSKRAATASEKQAEEEQGGGHGWGGARGRGSSREHRAACAHTQRGVGGGQGWGAGPSRGRGPGPHPHPVWSTRATCTHTEKHSSEHAVSCDA